MAVAHPHRPHHMAHDVRLIQDDPHTLLDRCQVAHGPLSAYHVRWRQNHSARIHHSSRASRADIREIILARRAVISRRRDQRVLLVDSAVQAVGQVVRQGREVSGREDSLALSPTFYIEINAPSQIEAFFVAQHGA
jgi:hypothetical protein